MSATRKLEEAHKKLSAILQKAQKLDVDSKKMSQLPAARKLLGSSNIRRSLILLACLILAMLYVAANFITKDSLYPSLDENQCIVQVPDSLHRIFRPPVSCSVCRNVSSVQKISRISLTEFAESYAYSGKPVVITDATKDWTAPQVFSYEFFRTLYQDQDRIGASQKCQFFPYKTDFRTLEEFLNLTDKSLNWHVPWYVGWSNCDVQITQMLRQHYQKPYFLPTNAEAKRLDWIFMGSKGYGAPMHIDNVEYPSWQAQLKGRKMWQLQPASECFYYCSCLQVVVEPGEIIVLDTNRWFHSTEIVSEENSITIGAEFD